jgi:hypothetical protein
MDLFPMKPSTLILGQLFCLGSAVFFPFDAVKHSGKEAFATAAALYLPGHSGVQRGEEGRSSDVAMQCVTIVLHAASSCVTAQRDEHSCVEGMGCGVFIVPTLADSSTLARLDFGCADAPTFSVRGYEGRFSWTLSLRPSVRFILTCLKMRRWTGRT